MADNLIFRIGFDLETAVKEAEREGASAIKRLETIFSRQPLVLKTDTSGFDELGKSAEVLKSRLKEIKDQWDKMPTSVKFDLDSGGKVKQLTSEGKALWEELMRINTALQGTSMGIQQMARESQRQLEAENKAEQKRQQAISASLRAEYKRIEAKKQAEAASRRELQMLNQRYAAEERRQRLAASQASIAKRQQVVKTLRAEENTIVNITAKLQHWQQVMNSSAMDGRQFKRAAEEVQRLSQKLSEAQARISQLTATTSNAAARQTAAVRQVSQEFKNQETYVSRLIKRMAVYASFRYASQFLTNIREVTAQFELQRVSLGAIIQDQQRANALFSEIKNFALQSPIKILDLTKYTKQVAAYGVETDKLFDTTKRIMDISVGLGVDAGRLVLAFGQVKAASYLRAAEIRQFTEAGIPMLELLAEKFTELNGKAVTTEQVMEMVSKRMVGFDMVEQIFKDMTSAGGMFYNMQEKQGNTLYGMWAKLGDAASVMYDQIGNTEAVNKGMKSAIDALTEFMRNWKATGAALAAGLGTVGIFAGSMKGTTWLIAAIHNLKQAQAEATQATRARVAAQERLNAALAKGSQNEIAAAQTALYNATQQEKAALKAMGQARIGTRIIKGLGKMFVGGVAAAAAFWAIEKVMSWTYKVVEAREAAARLNNALSEIKSKGMVDMSTAAKNFESLAHAAVTAADGSKRQRDALDELQRTYGSIIPAQDLQLEKLRAMNGEYTSLTAAIKENIAQQMLQQSVDTIKEDYAPRLKKTRQNLIDYLGKVVDKNTAQRVFDQRQAERIVENYERNIEKGLTASQALREALELEGEAYAGYTNSLLSRSSGVANQFYATQIGLRNAIKGVTDELADSAGELGIYQRAWQDMQSFNENMTIKSPKGTFAYSQEQKNEQIKNLRTFLQTVLGDAWSDSYAAIYATIGENADQMSELFWERIEAAANSPAQKNAVAKAKAAYYQIIPKDEVVRVFRDKAQEIANTQKYSMDSARQYLMGDSENLKDYRKRLEDEQKKIIENLIQYNATKRVIMASGGDTTEQDNLIKAVEKEKKYVKALLAALPVFPSSGRGGGRQSDPRLQILQEMVSTLKQVNKEYDELAKKEGATKALADTQRVYADTFKNMQQLAKQYKFALPDFGVPTDTTSLAKYLNAIREAMKKLPKSDKAVLALQVDIDKLDIDEQQRKIEAELKRLSDRISRTKTAKEFYEKILGMTGDVELAANLSLSIYGENGEDLDKAIRDNIQATLGKNKQGIDLDFSAAIRADGSVDYNALTKIAKGYLDMGEISEGTYNKILKMRDEDRKDLAKTVEGWMKATEKAKTYSDKLLDLRRRTQTEIDSINEKEVRGQISPEFAESQRAEFLRKEAEEVAKLQYEAFKDSPMYVQIFDDLEHASTTMLSAMRDRLIALKGEWKNLDPTQLKEMQSRLREIDAQLTSRNPFKALVAGIKQYRKLRTKGDALGSKSSGEADKKLLELTAKRVEAEKEYLTLLNDEKATKEQIADAKDKFDKAQAEEQGAQKAKEAWQDVSITIGSATDMILGGLGAIGDIANGVADIMEAVGADEEDVAYWRTIGDSIGEITAGLQDIVQSVMKGDLMGVITGVITAVPKMFVGFVNIFSAGKVRKANKEIKKQEELLKDLEYTYGRLEKAADKLFGGDYIQNFNQRLRALQAQQKAYEKQAEAERSKGKKEDKEKTKEYLESARDTMDEIADMQSELRDHFAGTDITSAARDFASAWIDAKTSFSDTTEAMRDKFKDMVQNMIIEAMAAKVMEHALQPFYNALDEAMADGDLSAEDIAKTTRIGLASITDMNNGMEVMWEQLKAAGLDVGKIWSDAESDYTGIAKNVSGATSEEINGLAGIGNTLMYYVSPIPRMDENLAAIRAIMERGATPLPATTAAGWTDWQQQAMDNYNAIARNTADTVVECRRAAEACEKMARAIKTKGATSGFNVFLNS